MFDKIEVEVSNEEATKKMLKMFTCCAYNPITFLFAFLPVKDNACMYVLHKSQKENFANIFC